MYWYGNIAKVDDSITIASPFCFTKQGMVFISKIDFFKAYPLLAPKCRVGARELTNPNPTPTQISDNSASRSLFFSVIGMYTIADAVEMLSVGSKIIIRRNSLNII